MKPEEITSIGRDLHGPLWKAKLASQLGRDSSTVSRWLAGRPIPQTAVRRIRELHLEHQKRKDAQK